MKDTKEVQMETLVQMLATIQKQLGQMAADVQVIRTIQQEKK